MAARRQRKAEELEKKEALELKKKEQRDKQTVKVVVCRHH